jgi:hypothetical protein
MLQLTPEYGYAALFRGIGVYSSAAAATAATLFQPLLMLQLW